MNLGKTGENRAVYYLDRKGYRIISRNYRCRVGEIDIIAMDEADNTLCFVEVKTRSSVSCGLPCEAVDGRKLRRIRDAASVYMGRFRHICDSVRIDVIEVLYIKERFYIRHIKNVSYGWDG